MSTLLFLPFTSVAATRIHTGAGHLYPVGVL
jgi:hypothetical protein